MKPKKVRTFKTSKKSYGSYIVALSVFLRIVAFLIGTFMPAEILNANSDSAIVKVLNEISEKLVSEHK